MRRIFLMSSVLFVVPFVFGESGEVSAQCVATQDCASLGYTEASCPNGGLKCPFGTTWSCKGEKENVSDDPKDIQCYNNCCIGYIYHSDGSCSKMPNTAKVALGVVVLLDGKGHGQAIATRHTGGSYDWSLRDELPSLPTYPLWKDAIDDYDSCKNTDALVAVNLSIAKAAKSFSPSNAPTTSGRWCVPAAGVISNYHRNKDAVNDGLTRLNASPLSSEAWTSTLNSSGYQRAGWTFQLSRDTNDGLSTLDYGKYTAVIYPVIEF